MIEIPLGNDRVALIDDVDAHLAEQRWSAMRRSDGKGFYARRGGDVLLHRVVMGAPKGMEVDHRDGNGLDCRRDNLRLATHAENGRNVRRSVLNTSGFKGVRLRRGRKGDRWQAFIREDKRQVCLGCFDTPVLAAHAYDDAAHRLFGEFARLNFPDRILLLEELAS